MYVLSKNVEIHQTMQMRRCCTNFWTLDTINHSINVDWAKHLFIWGIIFFSIRGSCLMLKCIIPTHCLSNDRFSFLRQFVRSNHFGKHSHLFVQVSHPMLAMQTKKCGNCLHLLIRDSCANKGPGLLYSLDKAIVVNYLR